MSRNDWEHGEITVPAAAMAGLHKALRDWVNTHHDAVRTQTAALHKEIGQGTRSVKLYSERLKAFQRQQWEKEAQNQRTGWGYRKPSEAAVAEAQAKAVALEVLERMLSQANRDETKGVHQPTVAEISQFAPKVTNRTAEFAVTSEDSSTDAYISFKSNVITWDVPGGNHAVERAHGAPLAMVFFAALGKIKWTRSSGGFATGNDEYNKDNTNFGGGANYITFAYGPVGENAQTEQSARNMGMTVAAYKKMMNKAPKHTPSYAGRW